MSFGQRLKTAREHRSYTQLDLANRSGVDQATISFYESDRKFPSVNNVKRLATALSVTSDYLLELTTPTP